MTLEILAEATALADPGEGAFDDPPLGQHDEAVEIGPLDDLQFPRPGLGDDLCHLRSLIAAIGIDAFDEGEGPPGLPEHGGGAIAVLNIDGMDDAQVEAEGIDEDMALAALDLLARGEARRVDRGSLLLHLWRFGRR